MTTPHFYSLVERYLDIEAEQAKRPTQSNELRLMRYREQLTAEFARLRSRRQFAQQPPYDL